MRRGFSFYGNCSALSVGYTGNLNTKILVSSDLIKVKYVTNVTRHSSGRMECSSLSDWILLKQVGPFLFVELYLEHRSVFLD